MKILYLIFNHNKISTYIHCKPFYHIDIYNMTSVMDISLPNSQILGFFNISSTSGSTVVL